ncbi:Outer membrane protein PagN [Ascidiaceihabitans donghaensis]|uniref:Outer membrane protein PagN n=1 Tax=Ascidiaceihabitans donghaensis TaxID=1510460 RepID=A0A2R8BGY6_9RHOB|nr:outer membrane beta-barrel protein [Ascidiaceihabitans donghaensis]SPH22275.1 Outer membrane protein PagN [Ascidiaceihabitans donghaensis]
MKQIAILGALATVALTTPAFAQDLYGFAYGGSAASADLNYGGTIGGAPNSVNNDLEGGYGLGVGVGKTFQAWSTDKIGLRGELELSFSDRDADQIQFSGNGPAAEVNVAGGIRTTALFANVIADFKTQGALTPFAGGGLGIAHINQDLVYGPGVRIQDSDTRLAAQAIVGVSYAASDRITLTADARYRRVFGVSSTRLSPAGTSTGTVRGDLESTSLNIGVRFNF